MRRGTKATIATLSALVLGFGGLMRATFAGRRPIEDNRELAPGVRTLGAGFVSAELLDVGEGGAALIDAESDPRGVSLLHALEARGLAPAAVRAIFLTHGHGDHTAGVLLFPRADVYALAEEIPLVEGRAQARSPVHRFASPHPTGIHVTHPLRDGDEVTVGTLTVRVFAVPGHTAGSAAYLARGVLFLGDSANGGLDGALRPAQWLFSDDTAQNRASLRALAARLEPESQGIHVLEFAHTGPLPGFAPLRAFAAQYAR